MTPSSDLYVALAGFTGALIGFLLRRYVAEARIRSAEEAARRIIEDAAKEAEASSGPKFSVLSDGRNSAKNPWTERRRP